jgi:sporulation protein YlmC with PRC-barrel domain
MSATIIRASEVIGKVVVDGSRENIGSVIDLLIDVSSSQTIVAVIGVGGALTSSDGSEELPLSALEYDQASDRYVVPFTKQQIADGAIGLGPRPRLQGCNQKAPKYGCR